MIIATVAANERVYNERYEFNYSVVKTFEITKETTMNRIIHIISHIEPQIIYYFRIISLNGLSSSEKQAFVSLLYSKGAIGLYISSKDIDRLIDDLKITEDDVIEQEEIVRLLQINMPVIMKDIYDDNT